MSTALTTRHNFFRVLFECCHGNLETLEFEHPRRLTPAMEADFRPGDERDLTPQYCLIYCDYFDVFDGAVPTLVNPDIHDFLNRMKIRAFRLPDVERRAGRRLTHLTMLADAWIITSGLPLIVPEEDAHLYPEVAEPEVVPTRRH